MKFEWSVWLVGLVFLFLAGGCQTGPFARPVAEERVFEVPVEVVFSEVRTLLGELSYRVQNVQPAAGRMEALSPIQAEPHLRQVVQRRLRLTVTEEAPGRTRVEVIGTLLEESENAGRGHGAATFERPLPKSFFDVFFLELTDRLEGLAPRAD